VDGCVPGTGELATGAAPLAVEVRLPDALAAGPSSEITSDLLGPPSMIAGTMAQPAIWAAIAIVAIAVHRRILGTLSVPFPGPRAA